MPSVPKLHLLPADVREELDQRLLNTGFGSLHEHTAWLRGLGHKVGPSTVGLYSQSHRASIEARAAATNVTGAISREAWIDARLRALHIARLGDPSGDPVPEAERLLAWVLRD